VHAGDTEHGVDAIGFQQPDQHLSASCHRLILTFGA
jgi:hypothetical protein